MEKKIKLKWILLLAVFHVGGLVYGQTDEQLAEEYFKAGECEKAVGYFEKYLVTRFKRSALRNYAECRLKTTDIKAADAFFKGAVKGGGDHVQLFYLQWGRILQKGGKAADADQKFRQALTSVGARVDKYLELAEEFKLVDLDWSIKTLLQAREVTRNKNLFAVELSELYRQNKDTEKAISEILSYGSVVSNPEIIRNLLQDMLANDSEREILEKYLYENIQKRPEDSFFVKLLVWQLIQRKDFYKAFIQERALDRRLKEGGTNIFQLGHLAMKNGDYESAAEMFGYIVKEYQGGSLYASARRMAILAREEKIKTSYPIVKTEVQQLITDYEKLVSEFSANVQTTEILESMRSIGILYGFYLDQKDKGIEILKKAIEAGVKDRLFVDKCKLDLGDIYLLTNDHWEASLIYSQVEKSQKEDLLGYEAKLKNARLHYFKGEFELSKGVLDVLKKATSREIANDANAIGLLIMDNIGLDSNETAMKSFANVELMLYQNKAGEALDSLKVLYEKYPDHSLSDDFLWLTAKTFMKLDSNAQAVDKLKLIVEKFGYDILADDALFTIGKIYEERLKKKEDAMRIYQELIEKYPGSLYVADARKRFRILRGDLIN